MAFVDFKSTVACCASLFLGYITILFCYRLLLHPLKGYPGPFAAKLTNGRNGYLAFLQHLHLTTLQDHHKYGPVVRQGPNRLVFNTVKALHDIYDNGKLQKSPVYLTTVQTPGIFNSFNIIDPQRHRLKRKVVSQTVNDRAMRIFEPTMMEQIDIFLSILLASSKKSQPVNVADRLEYLSGDIVGFLSFGHPLNMQTSRSHRFIIDGMLGFNQVVNVGMQWFRLHRLGLSFAVGLLTRSVQERYRTFLETMIKTRTSEDPHVRHDLYSVASSVDADATTLDDGVRMSEIWSEAVAFFPAGSISTAGTLSALMFYLVRNPDCYQKLAHEIRSTFESSQEIRNGPKLSGCQYLRACIDEALRIAPPIPGTLWREAVPPAKGKYEPLIMDGLVIPPGTELGVNAFAIHHNEEYFPDAFTFKPERWLPSETSEAQRKVMYEAFTPFSIGDRGCPGKPMAYLECSIVIAKILWYFNFEAAAGKLGEVGGGTLGRRDGRGIPGEYQLYDAFSGLHYGPYLEFHPRGNYCGDLHPEGLTLK